MYASKDLPITIVETVNASTVYRAYLGTDLLTVPSGSEERIEKWPALEPKNYFVEGKGEAYCAVDITFSSAGKLSIEIFSLIFHNTFFA